MAGRNFARLRLRLLRLWLRLLLWPVLPLRLLLRPRLRLLPVLPLRLLLRFGFPLGRRFRSGTFLGLVLVVCHVAPLGPG